MVKLSPKIVKAGLESKSSDSKESLVAKGKGQWKGKKEGSSISKQKLKHGKGTSNKDDKLKDRSSPFVNSKNQMELVAVDFSEKNDKKVSRELMK